MKIKIFSAALLSTIGLAFTLFALSQPQNIVKAQMQNANETPEYRNKRCGPRTMKGTHGYSYSGTVLGAEIAATGPITFDGYGNLHATYNVNLGGKPFTGAFTGTYIVNDDCTGTVTLHLPILGISSNGSFIIVNDGKETFFTGTDTGVAITGATKKL